MQIYKIYINEKPLFLSSEIDRFSLDSEKNNYLEVRYTGKPNQLFAYIDSLEKKSPYNGIVIYTNDYLKLKTDFKSLLTIVKAGGGLVMNEDQEALFIFRRGYWDIPKGKVEEGETRKEASVREVMEETGIKDVIRHDLITKTRHVFRNGKNKRMLKIVSWYYMTAPKQKLTPQAEEDIEKAIWLPTRRFLLEAKPVYRSIEDVVRLFIDKFGLIN